MEAKERLVVSNNSKSLERTDAKGQWESYQVSDKGNLANGVYALHQAKSIRHDTKGQYDGTIVHADKNSVYQDLGDKGMVRYERHAFPQEPQIGGFTSIQVEYGRARVNEKNVIAAQAASAVIDKQAISDGLDPQQRAVVAARVQQNLSNSAAAGKLPDVKIKEQVETPRTAKNEQERSR